MKKILLRTLAICSLLVGILSQKAHATHAAGAEIIYIHISDSTYQFIYKFYYDCDGVPPEPTTVPLCIYNSCTNQTYTRTMNKWAGTLPPDGRPNGTPVSTGCSTYPNRCSTTSSTLPGYEEWWYTHIETLSLQCNSWRFSTAINARNVSQNITGGNLYVETIFNSAISWVNSSPFYSIKPIPYVCLNQLYNYNNGARDSDGDSLHTELMRPLTAGTCAGPTSQVGIQTMTPAINFTNNPFQTGRSFSLTGTSGQISFTPGQLGAHALTVRTREYRNGVEIGSIMRDVQVQVLQCTTKPPVVTKASYIGGDTLANGDFAACIDQELTFCIGIKANKSTAVLIAEDDAGSYIPGLTSTYTGQKSDTITACFSWKPTSADAGKTHSFQLTIKDSTCEPPGILLQYVKSISIYVWPETKALPDTNICLGEPIFLGVSGGGAFEWSVLNGNDPSGFPKTGPAPIGQPTQTTTYQVVSTVNSYCVNSNKDTVEITVDEGPEIIGQPDTTTCPDNPVDLDVNIVTQTGVTYTTKWTPSTGLSNDTIPNPTVKIKNDRTYYIEVGSNINRCKSLDTVLVNILDGLSIENPDTAICQGDVVKVRGKGDPLYSYLWTSTDDPVAGYSPSDKIIETEIAPADTGKHFFKLAGSFPKCPNDTVTGFTITVEPNPSVEVDDDASMCYGDTMQMHGIVSPSSFNKYQYIWTPGASLDYPNSKDPIFSATSEGTITLTLEARTPEAGCSATASVDLTVFPVDFLMLPDDTVICAGDTMAIAMDVGGEPTFYWTPDFNISSVSSQQPRVWPVADQKFIVYGKDSTGCLDTNQIYVRVRPRAILEIPDSVTIFPGESYRMDPSGNCLYFSWFPPLGLSNADVANPMVKPDVNTRYIVHARTEAGCTVTDSVDVIVMDDSYLFVPNAFTPHSRDNNTLKLIRRKDIDLKRFEIYNRWGNKVFETLDVNEGWDGTRNGEMQPSGVYIYIIEAVTPSGKTIKKQGNVTLLQ